MRSESSVLPREACVRFAAVGDLYSGSAGGKARLEPPEALDSNELPAFTAE